MDEMNELNDIKLKNKLIELFVKKEADMTKPSCIAALITAASKMALATDIEIDEITTMDELIDLFNAGEETKKLIGKDLQYVKGNIGYSIDFTSYEPTRVTYESDKENYDEAYSGILNRSQERNNGRGM